jgi:hypothetical protein
MTSQERWIVLALLVVALVVGGRRLLRIADPDASLYAAPPSRR